MAKFDLFGNLGKKIGDALRDVTGETISVRHTVGRRSTIIVDGKVITDDAEGVVELRITEGVVQHVESDMAVTCGEVRGDVKSKMSVTCGDVGGNVDAGMSVDCGNIAGNATSKMSLTARDITGKASAGMSLNARTVRG